MNPLFGGFFLGRDWFGLWSGMENMARRALGFAQSHNSCQCFHFPSILFFSSLEECISGFFQHSASFVQQQERVLTVCIWDATECTKPESWNRPYQHLQSWRSSQWAVEASDYRPQHLIFGAVFAEFNHFNHWLHLGWISELSRTNKLFLRRLFSPDSSFCSPKDIGPSWRTGHVIRN